MEPTMMTHMTRALMIGALTALPTATHAGLFDDLKAAVTGHVADFQSRSLPDQVLDSARVIASGQFRTDDPGQDFAHTGKGGLSLVTREGEVFVQLHPDVEIGLAPDLYLYLSMARGIDSEERFAATEQIEVGPLVKGKGASYYSLGALSDTEINALGSVTVWCKRFGEFMASTDLVVPGE